MYKFPLLLAVMLLSASSSFAADKWTMVRSQSFSFIGNGGERQIQNIATNLELFRSAFSRLFAIRGSSVGTTIVVFRNEASLKPYQPLYKGKPANYAGYFQSNEDVNYIALTEEGDPSVIYHEYVHALMADSLGDLPLWFNEGIAEYYSTFMSFGSGKTFRLGSPISSHVELLKQRHFLPLEKLFEVQEDSPDYKEDEKQGVFYAQSWALVHYLMLGEGRKYQARVPDLIAAWQKGMPGVQSLVDVLQVDPVAFQKAFEVYVEQRQAFPAVDYTAPVALDPARDMQRRTMSEAEAEFYLGDLLLHMERFPEAETHLKKSLQLDGKLGEAQASMGRWLSKQQREAEALPYLKRAVELAPSNYLAHYYYALSVWNGLSGNAGAPASAGQRQTVRSELLKVIELAPQFVIAAEALARVSLSGGEKLGEALTFLRQARQMFPGKDSLGLMSAFILSRTQDRDSAPSLLQYLIGRSPEKSPVGQEARRLLELMNRQAADRRTAIGPGATGAATLKGTLTGVTCANGWTLSVNADGKSVTLETSNPSRIRLMTYTPTATGISCSNVPASGIPVLITYSPQTSGSALGEPLMIELFGRD